MVSSLARPPSSYGVTGGIAVMGSALGADTTVQELQA